MGSKIKILARSYLFISGLSPTKSRQPSPSPPTHSPWSSSGRPLSTRSMWQGGYKDRNARKVQTCSLYVYSNQWSWSHQSIFWLKEIHLRFGRRKSWLVPVQYLIGKRQSFSFNFQNTHKWSNFTDPFKFVLCDDIGVRCQACWIRQWQLGIAIFTCLILSF